MCNCIEQANNLLRQDNTELNYTLNLFDPNEPSRLCIETIRLDPFKKTKPKRFVATFCPICGERYVPEPVEILDTTQVSK